MHDPTAHEPVPEAVRDRPHQPAVLRRREDIREPLEPIVPYVRQPEGLVPGRPMFYATAFTLGGYATPLLVTSREFRPIKIEGNDRHPASQGGTDVFAQASLLDMYDPDRSQNVIYMGDISTWSTMVGALQGPLSAQKTLQGAGIRVLSRNFSSPTLADRCSGSRKLSRPPSGTSGSR